MYIKEFPFAKAVFLDGSKGDELDFLNNISIDPNAFTTQETQAIFYGILEAESQNIKGYEKHIAFKYGLGGEVILEIPRTIAMSALGSFIDASPIQALFNKHQRPRFWIERDGKAFTLTEGDGFAWAGRIPAYQTTIDGVDYFTARIDSGLGEDVYLCSVTQRPPQGY